MGQREVQRYNISGNVVDGVDVVEVIANRSKVLTDLEGIRGVMNAYLTWCDREGKIPCVAGLAKALGVSKGTLDSTFKNRGEDEQELYAMFMTALEDYGVQRLFEKSTSISAMFYLKQLGWRDDGVRMSSDNRSVTQIVITNGKGLEAVDVVTGEKSAKRIKRRAGRPKKYDGVIDIETEEVEDGRG